MKIRAVISTLAFGLALLLPAAAQGPISSFPPGSFSSPAARGGAAAPTLSGASAAVNGSCGFPAVACTITTTGAVTTGTVVAVAGVNNQGGSSGTISNISICGTSLTIDIANTVAAGKYGAAIGHGNVTGGASCTISVTFSVSSSVQNAGVAWLTLNNLSSSTPGTPCNAFYSQSQASPYPCTGGLTVSADGFGIVGHFNNLSGTPLTNGGGNVVVDATAVNSGGTSTNVGIGHVTANCTAAQCQYAGGGFASATTIGEPFR